jgi:hypothetical protein
MDFTMDFTLLEVVAVVAIVAIAVACIAYPTGKKDGEQETQSLPRSWCTNYTLFSDEGRVCRYSSEGGEEYIISKAQLRTFLRNEALSSCPRRVRICFSQYRDEHQVTSVEE